MDGEHTSETRILAPVDDVHIQRILRDLAMYGATVTQDGGWHLIDFEVARARLSFDEESISIQVSSLEMPARIGAKVLVQFVIASYAPSFPNGIEWYSRAPLG